MMILNQEEIDIIIEALKCLHFHTFGDETDRAKILNLKTKLETLNMSTCPYWHWSKAEWMHKDGTGHKTTRFYVPLGPHEWNILLGEKRHA